MESYQFVSLPDAYQTAKVILEKRFGHPSVVANAFRKRLENWQRIAPKDGAALREFADFLRTCKLAMHSVEDLETLNKESDNKKLVRILPGWAHPKWGTKVHDYQLKYGDTKLPPFTVFVNTRVFRERTPRNSGNYPRITCGLALATVLSATMCCHSIICTNNPLQWSIFCITAEFGFIYFGLVTEPLLHDSCAYHVNKSRKDV